MAECILLQQHMVPQRSSEGCQGSIRSREHRRSRHTCVLKCVAILIADAPTFADYPRTLREWGRRLQKNWTKENVAKLVADRPDLNTPEKLSFFKRNFEYMCAYTEVGYARAYLSLMVFTFARPVSGMKSGHRLVLMRLQEYVRQKCD
jgi:hypothetical protein